jgi:glycosyltransferase involved in cell wall biosynthesis
MNSISPSRRDIFSDSTDQPASPWLSILIPVYNVERYLDFCVRSITSQAAGRNIEILLLDDCSTDASQKLCLRLCAQYPLLLRLLSHQTNEGLSAARNSLLEAARGEYIWFIDSDDYMNPGSIQTLQSVIETQNPDLVLCDYRKNRFLKMKSFPGPGHMLERDTARLVNGVFESRKLYSWLKISRRSLWGDDLRFPIGKAYEDIATTPWLLLRAKSYYYVPQSWIFYRIRPDSIMGSVKRTPGFFDAKKNADLADALSGFKQTLSKNLGNEWGAPAYSISHFSAKEFTKIARRFNKAQNYPLALCGSKPATLKSYFDKMQQTSPYDYDTLSRLYLKKLRIFSFLALKRAMKLAKNDC